MPDVIWKGSPNFGYPRGKKGRNGYKPIAIVMHIAQGTMAGMDAWFNNPDSFASAHYAVSRDGKRIHCYVNETDAAWHAGLKSTDTHKPTWGLIKKDSQGRIINPNLYTLGVEHEGMSGDPWTNEMYEADVWLINELCKKWGIPKDRDHIIGHYEIDRIDRPNCPGSGLNWDELFRRLRSSSSGGQEPKPPVSEIDKLKKQIASLTKERDTCKKQRDSYKSQVSKLQKEVKSWKSKYEQERDLRQGVQKELEKCRTEAKGEKKLTDYSYGELLSALGSKLFGTWIGK